MLDAFRLALRRLVKTPGFTLLVVTTFSLGIALNTAVFFLTDRIVLHVLPVKDPQELVLVDTPGPSSGFFSATKRYPAPMSLPLLRDLRDKTNTFAGVFGYFQAPVAIGVQGAVEPAQADLVTGDYFPVLGIQPAHGRLFTRADDVTPLAHPLVVLSHDYFTRRFGSDATVVGKTILVNASAFEVAGVAPAGFRGLDIGARTDVFIPMMQKRQITPTWDLLEDRRARWVTPIARLRRDLTRTEALARANVLYSQILAEEIKAIPEASQRFRERFLAKKLVLLDGGAGAAALRESAQEPLRYLVVTAGLVLLVSTLNVAALLLTRTMRRRREVAVRLALGSAHASVVRDLLVEGVLIALMSLSIGLPLGSLMARGIANAIPDAQAIALFSAGLSPKVITLASLLALTAALGACIGPSLHVYRAHISSGLREGSGATSARSQRSRSFVVVGQAAVSLALVFGGLLVARSLFAISSAPLGLKAQDLTVFQIDPSLAGYDDARSRELFNRLAQDLRGEPGVIGLGLAENAVLADSRSSSTVTVPGYTPGETEDTNPTFNNVSPDFFGTLGIELMAGRTFARADTTTTQPVAIVNQAFVRHYFKMGDALGKVFSKDKDKPEETYTIVGIVPDFRQTSAKDELSRDQVFLPYTQAPGLTRMNVYLRTQPGFPLTLASVQSAMRRIDANLPVTAFKTLIQQNQETLFTERTMAFLASAFAAAALALSALGLYGLLAFDVAQRSREIGVRLAIGAAPRNIRSLILASAGRLGIWAFVAGIPLAGGLGYLIRSQLVGISAADPIAISTTIIVLLLTGAIAAWGPALRASRVRPAESLRAE